MAEISLDDLLKQKQTAEVKPAEVQTVTEVQAEVEAISPEDRQEIDKIKEGIDLMDSGAAIQFGIAPQKNIADFSDQILSQVRTKDSGDVGNLLLNLTGQINEFQEKENGGSFLKKIPLIGSLVNKAENMMTAYESLSKQVDKIQAELDKARMTMLKDIAMFDSLYEKNLGYFKSLQLYITAGEEKLTEMREQTLPKLRADVAASGNPMAAQVVNDFENTVERFEKKVHDLKISKTIAIQTAPQIRLIQNNDKVLTERVQNTIYTTIPLWKNQMVIALGLSSQQKVLKLQQAVNDTTNELLKQNAAKLRQNSVETAKENERSIVDVETVKKVNEDLIATIQETMKIQQEGRMKRQAAEQELVQIEAKLKDTLAKTL